MNEHPTIWKERDATLDHVEKCLLNLLRNPPDSVPSRLWERELKTAASRLGYEFPEIVLSTGRRDLVGLPVERCKSDESPVFFCGEKITTIS